MLFKEIPFSQSKRFSWILALNCSLFIYLFLVFFQPFGVNNYKMHSVITWELIIGVLPIVPVIFLVIYGSEGFLRPFFRGRLNWGRIPWYGLEFFLVGSFSFLLYNFLGNFHDFVFKSYLLHLLEVSSVLIFPFAATHFYFRFKHLEEEHKEVLSLSEDRSRMDELLKLRGDYKKDEIAIKPKDIVYLISEDNYVELNYLDSGHTKKYLIRSTLSKMQDTLDPKYFVRCHRSYLINLTQVVSYHKKQGRISIQLRGIEGEIPVSRTAEKHIMEKLSDLSSSST